MRASLIVPVTLFFGVSSTNAQVNGMEEDDVVNDPHELIIAQDPATQMYGYTAADGSLIAARFEEARSFSEGYAVVKERGSWGMIDTSGRLVLEASYDAVWAAEEGVTIAFRDGKDDPCLVEIGRQVKCVPFATYWTVWKEVLGASAMPDKVLIIRVLEMIPEPGRRLEEMANLEETYVMMGSVRSDAIRELLQAK